IDSVQDQIRQEEQILVVVGAEKVPREVYDLADYNVAVGNQPHSEISALAVLLDRVLQGKQFLKKHENAQREIVPVKRGKKVIDKTID
ncbi:MAG: tRNA (cytidine(56)-2'-O)-methyltransferase, partial [Nitrosopumilaceae archaeon]